MKVREDAGNADDKWKRSCIEEVTGERYCSRNRKSFYINFKVGPLLLFVARK